MSLLFALKPRFFGSSPAPTIAAPDPWHPFDAIEYKRYQELIKKRYAQQEVAEEIEEEIEEILEDLPKPKKPPRISPQQFWQIAEEIALEAKQSVTAELALIRLEAVLGQVYQARLAARERAYREKLVEDLTRVAELERRRRIAIQEEEALMLFALQEID